ncbi:MAG: hypothetical protein GWO20_15185 [Candidatus Korarchaeota archaeon]|nr:hypothetical protein [Candidatus Korarchaeota archaeon]NIU84763.1 hypothetical protein [Candidatus Thorarchaeota archaeon]NIW14396.1 hypothetical protein [Candidatus Thorarchaeota archaeon]NIW52837.1 hypothetical protein [Candidatus Korarchaeota archaeon]
MPTREVTKTERHSSEDECFLPRSLAVENLPHSSSSFHKETQNFQPEGSSSQMEGGTYWVKAGGNGNGTSRITPSGNISYVLTRYDLTNSLVNVLPSIYNSSIENFPLLLHFFNLTLFALEGATKTIIHGIAPCNIIHVTADKTTIKGFTIQNGVNGISVEGATSVLIEDNTLINNKHSGIYLLFSNASRIDGNSIINNSWSNVRIDYSHNNTITDNECAESTAAGVYVANSTDSVICVNNIYNNGVGIGIIEASDISIERNGIKENTMGIGIRKTTASVIQRNSLLRNKNPFDDGIGIGFYRTNNSFVRHNLILKNGHYGGLGLFNSTNNCIFGNNFINNKYHAIDDYGGNYFNNSIIGNYWDDYSGSDSDHDSIGDSPYATHGRGKSKDYCPSMDVFIIDATPPSVSIAHPSSETYTTPQLDINVTIYDFLCTVDTVLVEVNNTINVTLQPARERTYYHRYTFTEGLYALRVFANDTVGNMNSSQTVSFIVDLPPSVTILHPQNKTYTSSQIDINVTVKETVSAVDTVIAEVDSTENMSLVKYPHLYHTRCTLTDGIHTVTIYANDTSGYRNKNASVTFTVETEPRNKDGEDNRLDVATAIGIGTGACMSIAAIVIFFLKRKNGK